MEEEELISKLQAKDKVAFSYLYDNYSGALFGVLLKMLRDQHLAEDALQMTFVRIWKNIGKYDRSKGRLFTWMMTLTRNIARDVIRTKEFRVKKSNLENQELLLSLNGHSTNIDTDVIGLRSQVDKLDEGRQQVIELLYYQGYTQSEAAEELNIPLGTVKSRARSALQLLRVAVN